MSLLSDIKDGIASYGRVLQILKAFKLWKYLFIAGIISLVLGSSIFYIGYSYLDNFENWLGQWYPWEFGKAVFQKVTGLFGGTILLITCLLLYRYILMIVLSPIMSLISEKIEYEQTGVSPKTNVIEFGKSFIRGIRITLKNIFKELGLVIVLLVLSLIPVFTLFTTPLIFIVQSYYAGFSNMDYTMERFLTVNQSTGFVKRHKGLALANGAIFLGILVIPVLGLFIAPAFGTVAATVEVLKRKTHLV